MLVLDFKELISAARSEGSMEPQTSRKLASSSGSAALMVTLTRLPCLVIFMVLSPVVAIIQREVDSSVLSHPITWAVCLKEGALICLGFLERGGVKVVVTMGVGVATAPSELRWDG